MHGEEDDADVQRRQQRVQEGLEQLVTEVDGEQGQRREEDDCDTLFAHCLSLVCDWCSATLAAQQGRGQSSPSQKAKGRDDSPFLHPVSDADLITLSVARVSFRLARCRADPAAALYACSPLRGTANNASRPC